MKIAIGSDHRGLNQREIIAAAIVASGHTPIDCGTFSTESVDYPEIATLVAEKIISGEADRGVLLCGTGIGVSIAANKFDSIRAAVCWDLETVRLSREHNDANVLCLSAERFTLEQYHQMIALWLASPFAGGRHAQRVNKIKAIEDLRPFKN